MQYLDTAPKLNERVSMDYEKTSLKKPVRTKVTRKIEKDNLSKYSTFAITKHLLAKHQVAILYTLLAVTWTLCALRWANNY